MKRRFFKLYDADPADLVFILRNEADAAYETDIGTRYELRKRYWTFALDGIKQANSGNGAFANAAPSKSNCINGYFGIGGFNLCCVANYNGARVELYLAKGNAEENKAAFDMLYAYKNEIERKLGIRLEWDRGDGYKFSKVYCKLDDVSIENENDWLRMAKFHAERSRKFYDVFVPYLM